MIQIAGLPDIVQFGPGDGQAKEKVQIHLDPFLRPTTDR